MAPGRQAREAWLSRLLRDLQPPALTAALAAPPHGLGHRDRRRICGVGLGRDGIGDCAREDLLPAPENGPAAPSPPKVEEAAELAGRPAFWLPCDLSIAAVSSEYSCSFRQWPWA